MAKTCVSMSHFRVHLKEIANAVARGEERLLVARHDHEMFGVASREDFEWLEKQRPRKQPPAEAEMIRLGHPDTMPSELVDEMYQATNGSKDLAIIEWRGKAYLSIKLRTGKYPDKPPW